MHSLIIKFWLWHPPRFLFSCTLCLPSISYICCYDFNDTHPRFCITQCFSCSKTSCVYLEHPYRMFREGAGRGWPGGSQTDLDATLAPGSFIYGKMRYSGSYIAAEPGKLTVLVCKCSCSLHWSDSEASQYFSCHFSEVYVVDINT